jgi:hypothetical protein
MTVAESAEATMLVWLLVIAVTWVGTSNSIREIVKERPITRREANVGLSMTAYYLSKTIVLGAVTILQVLVLASIALVSQVFPAVGPNGEIEGVTGSAQLVELAMVLVVAGLAAMAVGLAASAFLKSSDQAMLVLPLLLVAHVVVSAPLNRQPMAALQVASWLSSAKWGTSAAASTVGLNELKQPPPGEVVEDIYVDPSWEHELGVWLISMTAMILITVIASGATWAVLRRSMSGKPLLDRQA